MPPPAAEPNLFELKGGGSTVRYTTSGMVGLPSLHFQSAEHDVHALGDDIRTSQTDMGTLISVDLEQAPDGPVTTLSLVIPTVRLAGKPTRPVRTVAILTATDDAGGGQLHRYRSIALRGTATQVLF